MNRAQPQPRWNSLTRLGALVASASLVLVPALRAASPPAAPAAPATGTIKGRLIYAAGPVPAPKISVKAGDTKVKDDVCKVKDITDKDLVVDEATKGIANGIAYLVKPTGDYTATEAALVEKTPNVVIDQVNCEFVPFATVVHMDQKLTFKSSDPVGHNVRFSSFANGSINQMLPPKGATNFAIKKEERRPVPLYCDIHPWMKGYFFIVDHPFAVVTQPDGSFELKDVPAGPQQLVVWQSAKGYVSEGGNKGIKVEVKAGAATDVGDVKITK